MPFIPRSKIIIKNTSGDELVYKDSRKSYIGSYIETSKGKLYAGTDNVNPGLELVKLRDKVTLTDKIFGYTKDVRKFNIIKKNVRDFLDKTKPLPVAKNIPTEKDYNRGFFQRYFSKRINGNSYVEIDKSVYNSLVAKDGTYDHNLYIIGSIRWYLRENTTGEAVKRNTLSLIRAENTFKNLRFLFPIFNEFLRPKTDVIEDLHTEGGELYYGDGTEYIGSYHIHPVKGPMEGAKHVLVPHARLYYTNQLPTPPDSSYDDFLTEYNKLTCYKCVIVQNTENHETEILEIKRSRLLGCPEGSFSGPNGYEEAFNACPLPPQGPSVPDINEADPNLIDRDLGSGNANVVYGCTDIGASNYNPNANVDDGSCYYPITFPDPPGGFGDGGDENDASGFGYPPSNTGTGGFGTGTGFSGGAGAGFGGGGLPGGTCFTANTLVTMADGSEKVISSIQVGEKVKSEIGESTVLDIQIHEGNHEVYSINGGKPFVTEEHPFKTIDGWKAIDPFLTYEKHQVSSNVLNLQDIVYKIDGKEIIESIEKGKTIYPKVYNLSLDNEHVYYANGYLVHNEKTWGGGDPGGSDGGIGWGSSLYDTTTSGW